MLESVSLTHDKRSPPRSNRASLWAALVALSWTALGCAHKMDPQECAKLREHSFELINQASVCSQDADCKGSEWPGCPKPVNMTKAEQIRQAKESFATGKCEEKLETCKPGPAVYCQEGLCAFRYKPAQPGLDQIKVE